MGVAIGRFVSWENHTNSFVEGGAEWAGKAGPEDRTAQLGGYLGRHALPTEAQVLPAVFSAPLRSTEGQGSATQGRRKVRGFLIPGNRSQGVQSMPGAGDQVRVGSHLAQHRPGSKWV